MTFTSLEKEVSGLPEKPTASAIKITVLYQVNVTTNCETRRGWEKTQKTKISTFASSPVLD